MTQDFRNRNGKIKASQRRERVIERLQSQLKSGTKPVKKSKTNESINLMPNDVERIKREIETLKFRLY